MVKQTQLFKLQSDDIIQKPTFYSSLEKLNQACSSCDRCSLSQKRHQVVIGRGENQPDIAIIGEAPGKQEDKLGQPFVGDSGKFLMKMLEAVQLDRSVYFTNVVRCRPPNNRKPSAEEIKACKPYLIDELRLVKPKIIICAGAIAVAGLTGRKESITSLRGKWLDWEDTPVMPLFHPAYLLRNPSLQKDSPKWLTWHDLIKVKIELEKSS